MILDKKTFGYFDKGVYNMLTNKFKKLLKINSKFIRRTKITIKKDIKVGNNYGGYFQLMTETK